MQLSLSTKDLQFYVGLRPLKTSRLKFIFQFCSIYVNFLSIRFESNYTLHMLYSCLQILHIFSATLLVTSMAYSFRLWRYMHSPRVDAIITNRIQIQTWMVVIPLAIFQLATGFTMISLQHEDLSQFWITGSSLGFIILIGSWFSFIYFLLQAQQLPNQRQESSVSNSRHQFFRRAQSAMLTICGASLLGMIFLMANKTA